MTELMQWIMITETGVVAAAVSFYFVVSGFVQLTPSLWHLLIKNLPQIAEELKKTDLKVKLEGTN